MMSLNHILRKCIDGYKLHESSEKKSTTKCTWTRSNSLPRMKKNGKPLNSQQGVWIYNEDIGMEFGIEKCAMFITKNWKLQMTEGIELPNQEKIVTFRKKKTYKYLGIYEADTIKQAKMKDYNRDWRTWKLKDEWRSSKLQHCWDRQGRVEIIQTTALLWSARILRRVLETWGNSSEKPSTNTGVKLSRKSKMKKVIMIE